MHKHVLNVYYIYKHKYIFLYIRLKPEDRAHCKKMQDEKDERSAVVSQGFHVSGALMVGDS